MMRRQDFVHVDMDVDGNVADVPCGRRVTDTHDCHQQPVRVDSHVTDRQTYYVPQSNVSTFSDDEVRPPQKSVVVDVDCCQYYEPPATVQRRTTDVRHRSTSCNGDAATTWKADQCPVYYTEDALWPPTNAAVWTYSRLPVSLSFNLKKRQ